MHKKLTSNLCRRSYSILTPALSDILWTSRTGAEQLYIAQIKWNKTLKALSQRQMIGCEWQSRTNKLLNNVRQLVDCIFSWIAEIDGTRVVAVHQCNQSGDEITDVLERPSLIPAAINLPPDEQYHTLELKNISPSLTMPWTTSRTICDLYFIVHFIFHIANCLLCIL